MKVIFLDTNIFIQCKTIDHIPWQDVADGDNYLYLLIPRIVQKEIDKHKQQGNNRRAKRARKASSYMRDIILSKDTKLEITKENISVEISFPPLSKMSCALPDALDKSNPDDGIIIEILQYQENFPKHDVLILTNDTNLLLTAKRCGIDYKIVPDQWLLPPETDSRDKKITKLETMVKELQNNYPIIEIYSLNNSGNNQDKFIVEFPTFPLLTSEEVDFIIDKVKGSHPKTTDFEKNTEESIEKKETLQFDLKYSIFEIKRTFVQPTEEQIDHYLTKRYPEWIENVKKYLLELNEQIEKSFRKFSFAFELKNNGNVPADNLIVEIKSVGNLFMTSLSKNNDSNVKDAPEFPPPPLAPEGHWEESKNPIFNTLGALSNCSTKSPISFLRDDYLASSLARPPKHDRNAFYWKKGSAGVPSKMWRFECEEFRHKAKSEQFNIEIIFPPTDEKKLKGSIQCNVSAKNLPTPTDIHVNIEFQFKKSNTVEEIIKYLKSNGTIS